MLYECHITLALADAKRGERVAKARHWKTSEIARDPVLGKDSFFYLTTYRDDFEAMLLEMRACSQACRMGGAEVLREKIELIVYDSKGKQ